MALLKVIAYGWRQSLRHRECARDPQARRRTCTSASRLSYHTCRRWSRSLGNAVDSFNASVGSMERNVLPQARKFTELGVTGEVLPSVDPIEQLVRTARE